MPIVTASLKEELSLMSPWLKIARRRLAPRSVGS